MVISRRFVMWLFLGVVVSAAAVLSSCDDAGASASPNLTLRIYRENTNPDDIVPELELEPIVEISPAIAGQTLFVGDDEGYLRLSDVPAGSYTVHPLFAAESYDVTVQVQEGETTDEVVLTPDIGLYYFVFNTQSASVPEFGNAAVRKGFSVGTERQDLLTAISGDQTEAYTLLPPAFLNDGLSDSDLTSVSEDREKANDYLDTGDTGVFDFEFLYNTVDDDTHKKIAEKWKQQMESLTNVGEVTPVEEALDTYLSLREQFDFQAARAGWLMDANNLSNYLKTLAEHSNYTNRGFTDLVTAADSALSNGSVDKYVTQVVAMHNHLIDNGVVLPIHFY